MKQEDVDVQTETQQDEHDGEYYCGLCGWVPIDQFPHDHDAGDNEQ